MLFRLTDFSILCHFHLGTFLSCVISTFGHFTENYFDLWTFRSNVISNLGLSVQRHFELLYEISTFVLFDPMLFRPLDISLKNNSTLKNFVLGKFDSQTFRSNVILTFAFFLCYFDLWTFNQNHFDLLYISYQSHFEVRTFRYYVISNQGDFGFMSFQPLHFSILLYFDLWTFHQKLFTNTFRTFRTNGCNTQFRIKSKGYIPKLKIVWSGFPLFTCINDWNSTNF